jgi:serpin B
VVPLAYRGSSIEMVLLVPKEIDGLAKVEQELSAEKLTEWLAKDDGWRDVKLKLYLPKLAYESRFDLFAAISQLGVKDVLFTGTADLSPMFGPESLHAPNPPFLTKFLHTSGVRVSEEGTVAWSKTAVLIDWGGELPQKNLTIRADRPFLFLIRERKTAMVLYLGRVVDPSQQ